jgi:hypothetical protein
MSRLFELAAETRKEFENDSINRDLLGELYLAYNLDPAIRENLDGFLEAAFRTFPKGCCGLSAVYLQHKNGGAGDVRERCEYNGRQHTLYLPFCRIGNFVLDITADQFGGAPVYAGPIRPPRRVV